MIKGCAIVQPGPAVAGPILKSHSIRRVAFFYFNCYIRSAE